MVDAAGADGPPPRGICFLLLLKTREQILRRPLLATPAALVFEQLLGVGEAFDLLGRHHDLQAAVVTTLGHTETAVWQQRGAARPDKLLLHLLQPLVSTLQVAIVASTKGPDAHVAFDGLTLPLNLTALLKALLAKHALVCEHVVVVVVAGQIRDCNPCWGLTGQRFPVPYPN